MFSVKKSVKNKDNSIQKPGFQHPYLKTRVGGDAEWCRAVASCGRCLWEVFQCQIHLGKILLDSCYGTLSLNMLISSINLLKPARLLSPMGIHMCLIFESLCQCAKRKSMEVLLTLKHPAALSFRACRSLQVSAVVSARLGSSAARRKPQSPLETTSGHITTGGQAYFACRSIYFLSFQTIWAPPTLRLRWPIGGAVSGLLVNVFSGFPQNFLIWGGFSIELSEK
jgi:hypothetical protein